MTELDGVQNKRYDGVTRRKSSMLEEGTRRRSSALEAKGFPTITEPKNDGGSDTYEKKRERVKRVFGFPISIPFIISNEFCERFSYYGMRTILTIYFTKKLSMSDETATLWFHEFAALCYATPLLGAIIADVFIGKFMTILIMSTVYLIGNAVMAMSAVGKWSVFQNSASYDEASGFYDYVPEFWGPILALHLIALGTGGIKPCVSSFGGDQFKVTEGLQLQRFFSMFYFSINAGSVIATAITPELRGMSCLGEDTCYPLAFGVPAFFMVIATVAFLIASRWYVKIPPLGNPIIDVSKVTWAMFFGKESPVKLYGAKKVEETKQLGRVLAVFVPFPLFWALFDQQSSRWVMQADRMNGKIGSFEIKPDQMQVINPAFVMCLIPFFEIVVYPLMKKIGIPTSPAFRIVVGMFFAAIAFIVCGFVELAMEKRVSSWNIVHPDDIRILSTMDKEHQLHVLTMIPQIFLITCAEILCSITVIEFAYAYAPPSMKSVCQSMMLITSSFGNLVVVIFTKVTKRDLYQYFMWAGIQIFASVLMYLICRRVQAPLDEYKKRTLEGDAVEMTNTQDKREAS
ncbi:peptide transporter family 1-like isoform X2 [Bolinopsis microptera]|uniref:peptide transporter family 1-like isoform X2 n=1 Tax=Bolinopsis microptera TaxID=2820187 RepID=UPI003078AF57